MLFVARNTSDLPGNADNSVVSEAVRTHYGEVVHWTAVKKEVAVGG